MDSGMPRKRSKLSLARAKKSESSVDKNEVDDVFYNNEQEASAVTDGKAAETSTNVGENDTESDSRMKVDSLRDPVLPYHPLPTMKLKIWESPVNKENILLENVFKETGYKPLPKRIIKLWKHPPKMLKHNLFEECTDQNEEDCIDNLNGDIVCHKKWAEKKPNDKSHKSNNFKKHSNQKVTELSKNSSSSKGASKNIKEQVVEDSPRKSTTADEPSTSRISTDLPDVQPTKNDLSNSPDALTYCPLCQAPFTAGMTQIDRDSHLAACLASTADDVIW